jgi:hypothetical protein
MGIRLSQKRPLEPAALRGILAAAMLVPVFFGFTRLTSSDASPRTPLPSAAVPPFHAHPPRQPLPQVLPWREFFTNPWAENAYRLAARIRPVLYQQPCYCWCSKTLGHTCLLDCFTRPDKHAADCQTCLKEALFAYQQTLRGTNARTIRAQIIKGAWAKVNLAHYSHPPAP